MGSVNIFITSEAGIDKNTKQFEEELRHIKCGLLYGDRTTVLSVVSYALVALHNLYLAARDARLPLDKRVNNINRFLDATGIERLPAEKLRNITTHELEKFVAPIADLMWKYLADFGWSEIAEATQSQNVKFISPQEGSDPYQYLKQLLSENKDGETKILPTLYSIRAKKILEKASCYPLLSDAIRERMQQEIAIGLMDVKKENIGKSKTAGLSSYMFTELPSFEGANVQQIIELRKYLNKYLKNFRHATVKYSKKIEKAQWDNDFIFDAKNVFDRDVLPDLKQLKEIIKTDSAIRQFGSNLLKISKGSVLSLLIGVGSAAMFGDLAAGIATTASGLLLDSAVPTVGDKVKKHQAIQRNGLYFYLKAGKLLRP